MTNLPSKCIILVVILLLLMFISLTVSRIIWKLLFLNQHDYSCTRRWFILQSFWKIVEKPSNRTENSSHPKTSIFSAEGMLHDCHTKMALSLWASVQSKLCRTSLEQLTSVSFKWFWMALNNFSMLIILHL